MIEKSTENRVRREARRKGLLLRKSRSRTQDAEAYGLYVLIQDCAGNRRPGAQAPYSAFARGEGMTLEQISAELDPLPAWV